MNARTAPATAASRRSEARERLLDTAAGLFYAEGVRAVGVDRLIAEAGITKATFYRHFPGKDELVLAYLDRRDRDVRERLAAAAAASPDPRSTLAVLVAALADEVCGPGFRGCPFINAAAEYPDADHPVRRLVAAHRRWFRDALADLLTACGHLDPAGGAAALLLLRDGAMVAGYLDGTETRDRITATAAALLGPLP
ncbi:TetR/AcrR family transcriptional regulator [Kitasatospora sp. DSM 101779]|uniref:TetR/AcrR family transcriptional regulator n=1 Tax=Kitasatospora sp. DSM 101779 TaxID=2853165 RepID=UPI0021D8ECEE|nr:TetR/AcrR family transcriptional regulator [Kitasatospora sp. DSM 101779]MCU7825868.1 TetR/AcrR family transcriptional regulator [Kitasatospora sp. DSM 101779]